VPVRVRITLLSALVAGLLPTTVAAQASGGTMPAAPAADAFTILYYLTDKDGNRTTPMGQQHFTQFLNRARCECGHQIQAKIRLKTSAGMVYNPALITQTFVGTNCGTAESNPVGQFKKCAQLLSAPVPTYYNGIDANFHPIWLAAGVDPSSTVRDPVKALAAGTCEAGVQGQSGIWMCAQTNTMNGCQSDEFFISGMQNTNLGKSGGMIGISYDFLAPSIDTIKAISANSGDKAVVVSWDLDTTGDIFGWRVLCEDAETGKPPPGKGASSPALNAIPTGTIYYTKDNLCPDGPFSLFTPGPSANTPDDFDSDSAGDSVGDSTTTTDGTTTTDSSATTGGLRSFEATTGTGTSGTSGTSTDSSTTDTSGTTTDTTGATTGTTGADAVCGNLKVEGDEECDEGPSNSANATCNANCILNVCGDADKSPTEECDDGEANNGDDKLCGSDCTLHISDGMRDLDWSYICTQHLSFNSTSVRIDGLENDRRYNFYLVAYDKFGNPAPFSKLVTAIPVETYDVWDQCHVLGDVCGKSGFCNVAGDGDPLLGFGGLLGLGLGFAGLRRRKRNRA